MRRLFHILSLTAILILSTGPASIDAQTFQVTVKNPRTGATSIMEVYEYDDVNEKPSFPGGENELMNFINNKREYPQAAYSKGIQGRVTCSFVVNTNGSISHISVLRGVEASLNKEAMRVLSEMPTWIPGKLNGKTVPTRVIWSVPFRK